MIYNEQKLEAAIEYLKSRKIWLLDNGNKFIPTDAANTDVAATMRRYCQQVEGAPSLKQVKVN
jgi:hypothetical protein